MSTRTPIGRSQVLWGYTAVALLSLCLGGPVLGQGADDCALAVPITVGSYAGSTDGATRDGTASCGRSELSSDVWYSYTAPADGWLNLNTCNGLGRNAVVSIHSECPTEPSEELACGYFCWCDGAFASTRVEAGETYLVRVSAPDRTEVDFTLHVDEEPHVGNDDCVDAIDVGEGSHVGSIETATPDGATSCATSCQPNVWYRYTATETGILTVETAADYTTLTSVHTGCPGDTDNEIGCNVDGDLTRTLASVTEGETYLIRVSGFVGTDIYDEFTMDISVGTRPANDACEEAIDLGPGSVSGTTLNAFPEGTASCGSSDETPDVWYRYSPATDGLVTIATCGADFDTVVSLHSECPGPGASEASCNDDGTCDLASTLTAPVSAGETYWVRVSGYSGAAGSFDLDLTEQPGGVLDSAVWTDVTPAFSPIGRQEHAMVYDPGSGTTVLFGGIGANGQESQDTWGWDGASWTQLATTGPSRRHGHAMAYDPDREAIVLFGGNRGEFGVGPFRDTWLWNGTAWSQVANSGPSARDGHAMAYHETDGTTVLFGGYTIDGIENDTWEWDGASWIRRALGGPVSRWGHAMAYDPEREVVVLHGGERSDDSALSDTWEWDGRFWSRVSDDGPPRKHHAMAFDRERGVIVLHGGRSKDSFDTFVADTWEWDGSSWNQAAVEGPEPRLHHAAAYDEARSRTVVYGGEVTPIQVTNDTWELDGAIRLSPAVLIRGRASDLRVRGAEPGELVFFLRGTEAPGAGTCPPQLGSRCLDLDAPISVLGSVAADSNGEAVLTLSVPESLPLGAISLEAAVVRGPGAESSQSSNLIIAPVLDPIDVSLSHTAALPTEWLWGYRLTNTDDEEVDTELTVAHERPDGTVTITEGPSIVTVPAAGGLDETKTLMLDVGEPTGVHRVRVTIADPVSGALLDEGSARVHVGSGTAPANGRPTGDGVDIGNVPNLTVNARVETGQSWSYRYEIVNTGTDVRIIEVEVTLTAPSGAAVAVETTEHTLAAGELREVIGSHPLTPGDELGEYVAVASLFEDDGSPLGSSTSVRFVLIEPAP